MIRVFDLNVARVHFAIHCDSPIRIFEAESAYEPFLFTKGEELSISDILAHVELGEMPDIKRITKVFESGPSWSLLKDGNHFIITKIPPNAPHEAPFWVARFDAGVNRVDIYLSDKMIRSTDSGILVENPVRYPLDQLLLMYYLARRQGVLLHSAGLNLDGKGFIFPGKSGAGKSTISGLMLSHADSEIYSDDRMIVRKVDGSFRAYGTPWPGDAGIALNKSTPLSGILFIKHAQENRIIELTSQQAFERLLPVASIPWYDPETMNPILTFCEDLVTNIPAYDLHFRPDEGVVKLLEDFLLVSEFHLGTHPTR